MVAKNRSVWEIAVEESHKRRSNIEENDTSNQQATLVFVGSRGSGKTTIIQRFVDREETPKPTLALEYTYARKSGRSLVKDVCHVWELGGGAVFTSLLTTPLSFRTIATSTVIIVLNLAMPETIWTNIELMLREIRKRVDAILSSQESLKINLQEKQTKSTWDRLGQDHQDREGMNPSLVPLIIVGGQYDAFHEFDPESKKLICRALRFIAHSNGAGLYFFSSKDAGLVKKLKELMSHRAFGSVESGSLSQDYNKPLIIPAGSDSFQAIKGSLEVANTAMTYDGWKQKFAAKYPQADERKIIIPEDPSSDRNYAEPDVDNLRSQKEQELEALRYRIGRRDKFEEY